MLRRLFRRSGRRDDAANDVVLRLKYEPSPENLAEFAVDVVASAEGISGVKLDYTPASLALVDDIIEGFRSEGVGSRQVGETLFGFGCYVGEVSVRHAGGRWRRTEETPMRGIAGHAFVIELPAGNYCNPLAKTFKRMDDGSVDSLAYFYRVVANDEARDIRAR
ncbi:MAG: hypothetical protein AB1736_05250 [Chloroflexota bacterium]